MLEHEDEVWHLQFSHAGSLLASGTKDGTAVIWEMAGPRRRLTKRHTLKGHQGPVVFVTWSPDDSKLATCGAAPAPLLRPCALAAAFSATCCLPTACKKACAT